MNRRAFLALLLVVPFLKRAKPVQPKPALTFHPDAFAFVMEPLSRVECLYGYATIRPEFAVRAVDQFNGDGQFIE